jgi:hypothetical protein
VGARCGWQRRPLAGNAAPVPVACTSACGGGTVGRGVGIGVANQLGAADAGESLLTTRRAWTRTARAVHARRAQGRDAEAAWPAGINDYAHVPALGRDVEEGPDGSGGRGRDCGGNEKDGRVVGIRMGAFVGNGAENGLLVGDGDRKMGAGAAVPALPCLTGANRGRDCGGNEKDGRVVGIRMGAFMGNGAENGLLVGDGDRKMGAGAAVPALPCPTGTSSSSSSSSSVISPFRTRSDACGGSVISPSRMLRAACGACAGSGAWCRHGLDLSVEGGFEKVDRESWAESTLLDSSGLNAQVVSDERAEMTCDI